MSEDLFNLRLDEVKSDIYRGIFECNKRGLLQNAKWLSELAHGLCDIEVEVKEIENSAENEIKLVDYDNYLLAKSYYDCKEYDRAAYFTRNCESSIPKFIHLYSTYMAKEKKRLDNMTENTAQNSSNHLKNLTVLLSLLKTEYNQRKMDGYSLYLYGIVLKKLELTQMAITIFLESVHKTPSLWGAWLELSPLISDKEQLESLKLPNHWMKHIFIAHTLIELFLNDEGFKYYEDLQLAGFGKCSYVITQIALAHQNKRGMI